MRRLFRWILFCVAASTAGLAMAQFAPPLQPGGPFPPQLPQPLPPPPPPPQIGHHPQLGPWCAGPLGPGPCLDVHRFLRVQHAANYIQLPFLGMNGPVPVCSGPLGPGPCRDIQVFLAMRTVALQEMQAPPWHSGGLCLGPMGPAPCEAIKEYMVQAQLGFVAPGLQLRQPQVMPQPSPTGEAMCLGPAGPLPCVLLSQISLDLLGGQSAGIAAAAGANAVQIAQTCARHVGLDVGAFAACSGNRVVLPQWQHEVLECASTSRDTPSFAACAARRYGIGLSDEQRRLAACAVSSKGVEDAFRKCGGPAFVSRSLSDDEKVILNCATQSQDAVQFGQCAGSSFMGGAQKAVMDCAMRATDAASFAICAGPNVGVRMSNEQRILAKCALQSRGDSSDFARCAGAGLVGGSLGPNEQKVLGCAASAGGDTAKFAACSANSVFGERLSREQQIAVQCAAQSQGDATGFATCAGANLLGMQLNPEQQIAVQCLVTTGGQPYAAAGCMASRLTARELSKCVSHGIGGKKGCFGDNNDLVGKNGFVGRTISQLAGGPNSVINNPNQLWGGDNSFVRNPGQIWGGPNSFVRNPSQIWGGPNSVFNKPSQVINTPRPLQLGTVGGKRICLPWC